MTLKKKKKKKGKNIRDHDFGKNEENENKNNNNTALSFRLSSEIQSVLIEDFFPPISSSTVPGNPGRLYVNLIDILKS
jgi:hypothetical protein